MQVFDGQVHPPEYVVKVFTSGATEVIWLARPADAGAALDLSAVVGVLQAHGLKWKDEDGFLRVQRQATRDLIELFKA